MLNGFVGLDLVAILCSMYQASDSSYYEIRPLGLGLGDVFFRGMYLEKYASVSLEKYSPRPKNSVARPCMVQDSIIIGKSRWPQDSVIA